MSTKYPDEISKTGLVHHQLQYKVLNPMCFSMLGIFLKNTLQFFVMHWHNGRGVNVLFVWRKFTIWKCSTRIPFKMLFFWALALKLHIIRCWKE